MVVRLVEHPELRGWSPLTEADQRRPETLAGAQGVQWTLGQSERELVGS
jgi:hypothetical protein